MGCPSEQSLPANWVAGLGTSLTGGLSGYLIFRQWARELARHPSAGEISQLASTATAVCVLVCFWIGFLGWKESPVRLVATPVVTVGGVVVGAIASCPLLTMGAPLLALAGGPLAGALVNVIVMLATSRPHCCSREEALRALAICLGTGMTAAALHDTLCQDSASAFLLMLIGGILHPVLIFGASATSFTLISWSTSSKTEGGGSRSGRVA